MLGPPGSARQVSLTRCHCGSVGHPEPGSQQQDPGHQHLLESRALATGSYPTGRTKKWVLLGEGSSNPGTFALAQGGGCSDGAGWVAHSDHREFTKGQPLNSPPLYS